MAVTAKPRGPLYCNFVTGQVSADFVPRPPAVAGKLPLILTCREFLPVQHLLPYLLLAQLGLFLAMQLLLLRYLSGSC